MKRNHFVVVLAHPVYGRIKRLHLPHYSIHIALAAVVLTAIVAVGLTSSYVRLLSKASEFNAMRSEKEALRKRYDELRKKFAESDARAASLGALASEVSIAFGIRRAVDEHGDFTPESALVAQASFDPASQYDLLRAVRLPSRDGGAILGMLSNTTPSIWPVKGRINSPFGRRLDPLLGKGAFHSGIDLKAGSGTAVVATADGSVVEAGWSGGYGKRVRISHGRNGLNTLYAHLTEMFVVPGQVVRRGEVIGRAGSTGRSTSSHLHYEVRLRGTPVNPYRYLRKATPESTVGGLVSAD